MHFRPKGPTPGPEFPLGLSSLSESEREEIKVEIQDPQFLDKVWNAPGLSGLMKARTVGAHAVSPTAYTNHSDSSTVLKGLMKSRTVGVHAVIPTAYTNHSDSAAVLKGLRKLRTVGVHPV